MAYQFKKRPSLEMNRGVHYRREMIGKTAAATDTGMGSREHTDSYNNSMYFDIITPLITFHIVAGVGHDLRMTIRSIGHVPYAPRSPALDSSPL